MNVVEEQAGYQREFDIWNDYQESWHNQKGLVYTNIKIIQSNQGKKLCELEDRPDCRCSDGSRTAQTGPASCGCEL